MNAVFDFIHNLEGKQKDIALFLDELLTTYPTISSKIRYKIPFYFQKSWICYLNPIKKEGIELAFTRANELSNDTSILDFKDRKQVGGILIKDLNKMPVEAIVTTFEEALLLDETFQYQSKRLKK